MAEHLEKAVELTLKPNETRVVVETPLAENTAVVVGDDAHLVHYRLSDGANNALTVKLGKNASYDLVTVHLGSGKLSVYADLAGEGCFCRSDAVYALNGDERAEIKTDFRHNADKTTSRQLVKGAVGGHAKAVFDGGILIPYNKKAIDGAQQHRALLLSKTAEVKAVPKLEIYADDVKCAHGSAIGTLNKDQLFYLQTRGIDEAQARRILTAAFLNEVLDTMRIPELRDEWGRLIGLKNDD